jgi:hypothetical protein
LEDKLLVKTHDTNSSIDRLVHVSVAGRLNKELIYTSNQELALRQNHSHLDGQFHGTQTAYFKLKAQQEEFLSLRVRC